MTVTYGIAVKNLARNYYVSGNSHYSLLVLVSRWFVTRTITGGYNDNAYVGLSERQMSQHACSSGVGVLVYNYHYRLVCLYHSHTERQFECGSHTVGILRGLHCPT
jgi:hypothetical protein